MKAKLIAFITLSWVLLASAQTADTYIAAGRLDLGRSADNLWGADTNFLKALQLSPTNTTANVLEAVTRLLVLPQQPAGSNFLNSLGITNAGHDLYNWTAQLPQDTNGNSVFPANYNSSTAISFLRNTLLAAITASATNLANVKDPAYTLSLTATETTSQDATVDYGDIQLLRAMLAMGQFACYTLNAQNFSVVVPTIQKMAQNNTLTIQSLLSTYPSLLALNSSADLASSKAALTNAIAFYFAASDFIRNHRAPGGNPLFQFDASDPTDVADEAEFRTDLTNVLLSLRGPTVIDSKLTFSINASNYFSGAKTLRSLVPQFNGDTYVNNSLPDYTFGGVLSGLPAYQTEAGLRNGFYSFAGIYNGYGQVYDSDGYNNGNFAVFVGANQQAVLVGHDDGDGTGNNNFGMSAQFTLDKGGNWSFQSNSFSGFGSFDKSGDFNGELDFSNGVSVYLYGYQQSPLGPFQNSAGIYSGLYNANEGGHASSGTVQVIVAADGEVFYVPLQTSPSANISSGGGPGYLNSSNQFSYTQVTGSIISGTLNTNTFVLTGSLSGNISGSYSASRSAKDQFDVPPVLTLAPANKVVGAGSNVTFSVTATGSAPLCFQWYVNNVPIPGAITNSLIISNATLSINGNLYSVSIQNVVGETNSSAYLTVQDASKPTVAAGNLIAGQRVSNAVFTVNGTSTDNSGVIAVWYQIGNGPWTMASTTNGWTNWWANLPLTPGTNTFRTYAVDNNSRDQIYVADLGNNLIRKINPAGAATTLAGDTNATDISNNNNFGHADGLGSAASFDGPAGVALDAAGNVYVADEDNNLIREISPAGLVKTLAGDTNANDIINKNNSGYADGPGSAALFSYPAGVAVDAVGNIYVADQNNNLIRKVTPAGLVSTLAGDTNANDIINNANSGYTDGPGNAALFSYPAGVAVDEAGSVYVADQNNNLIRKITSDGTVTTIAGDTNADDLNSGSNFGSDDGVGSAASFHYPTGVAVDNFGNVYVADSGNNLIRKITPGGMVSTLAGDTNAFDLTHGENSGYADGPGSGALLNNPAGVSVDNYGNVYVADTYNNLIRKITPANIVLTLAGDTYDLTNNSGPNFGYADGLGGAALFGNPASVAVDNGGGNVSVTNSLTFQFVVTNQLALLANGLGTITPNDSNAWLEIGRNYSLTATPGAGFTFTNWTISTNWLGGVQTNKATVQFMMASNLTLAVGFVDTNNPSLSITNLAAGQRISNGVFNVKGTASDNWQVGNVSYQLNNNGWTNAAGTTNWAALLALIPGTNLVAAYAVDTTGNHSLTNRVNLQFVVTNQLGVLANGLGTITPNDNHAWLEVGRNYSMAAVPGTGFIFTNWITATNGNWPGGLLTNNATVQFMMASNLTLQVNFIETSKPLLNVSAPGSGQKMSNALASLVGTASDNWKVTGVWYQLNNNPWNLAGTTNGFTNWTKTVSLLAGTNTLKIYAQNLGGNFSTTNSFSVFSTNAFKLQLAFSNALMNAGAVSFNLQLSTGMNGHIQVSTNLINWITMTNFVGTNSSLIIRDPTATNSDHRFYRAVVP